MKSIGRENRKIPAFTVLLLMVAIAVIGIAVLPTLEIRYAPEETSSGVSVSYYWPDVSERIIEAEVTSKIEGVLSGMANCTGISSTSNRGSGYITLYFKKGTDMAAVRFEMASRIRNVYPSLPDGVSYPSISLGIRGTGGQTDLVYIFKSPLPSLEIEKYISGNIMIPISSIDGVENVSFNGATPFEMEITFDADRSNTLGISAGDIASAFADWKRTDVVGLTRVDDDIVTLKICGSSSDDIKDIPVKNVSGHIVRLGDIASVSYKESAPLSYFRLNGLNTLTLNVSTSPESNLLAVTSAVKARMNELQESFPDEITATLDYDSSEYIAEELEKIVVRTLLCILILLVFVFFVYRSLRYVLIIFTTLFVNILIAAVIYKITGLGIHIYTLAGITVSLGIIIDSSIVMADHYSYYGNRSVFPALLGATATTIGALCVVGLLPDEMKRNLADFSKVIIINLTVSLLTSYAFIPSLIDKFPIKRGVTNYSVKRMRRVIRFNELYNRFIVYGKSHKGIFALIMIVAFGIPLCLLPARVAEDVPDEEKTFFQKAYNKILSWPVYSDNRHIIDKIAGTSFALFDKALDKSDIYREPGRNTLYINAGMPEGCTVAQLNEVVKSMENYLSRFDEIESFSTNINSFDNARISVVFKPEFENTFFPDELKSRVIDMARNFGGANWRVSGVNDSYFNNNVVSNYKGCGIVLTGYNYDELVGYAEGLINRISENRRVSAPELMNGSSMLASNEFNLNYDFSSIASRDISPYRYFGELASRLYDQRIGDISYNDVETPVVLRSSDAFRFDLWHVTNTGIDVDSIKVKLSEVGSIEKKRSGLSIRRNNQSYEVLVGFDFIGSGELQNRFMEEQVRIMNDEILPVGYRAEIMGYSSWSQEKVKYAWLIMLVILIIYVMCSMIFESLRLPFAVILMIPVSFVGVFLTFGLTDFIFDQGGFAAMVMLSGIVVNAGIYIINEYGNRRMERAKKGWAMEGTELKDYVRCFNHKISPILLTIFSTVLGLIPFLFDGPKEVFWFAFAIGTIGGMLFSIIALFCFLPVFLFKRKAR